MHKNFDEEFQIFQIEFKDNKEQIKEINSNKLIKSNYNVYYTNNPTYFPDFDNGIQFSKHLCNISDKYLYEKFSEDITKQYKTNVGSFRQIMEMYENEILQYGIRAFYEAKAKFPDEWTLPEKIGIGFKFHYVLNSFKYMLDRIEEKIKVIRNTNENFQSLNEYKHLEKIFKEFDYVSKLIKIHHISGNPLSKRIDWKYFLKWLSILNFIVQSYQGSGEIINENFILEAIEKMYMQDENEETKKIYDSIDKFIEYFSKDLMVEGALYSVPREYFEKVNEIITLLEKLEKDRKNFYFSIPLEEYIVEILELIKFHQSITVTVASFLDFALFPRMSDGHQEYFNIFAKIYMCLETPFEKPKHNDTIFMLLDEMVNFFHPNWQKQFINIFIEFLRKNYPYYNFHLIFTTHSPFIISDLPKENIIFLDKDENGKCRVVDGLNEKKETFGANIHTLLSDSFFMEDGLIGKFAESKINEVIKYLNSNENSKMKNDKYQKIINIIGEPILRKELQRRLDSKRLKKVDEIDKIKKEIELLEHRLELLRKNS